MLCDVCCLLLVERRVLSVGCYWLCGVVCYCAMLLVGLRLVYVARCSFVVVRYVLFADRCSACCLPFVVCRLLSVVCSVWFVG